MIGTQLKQIRVKQKVTYAKLSALTGLTAKTQREVENDNNCKINTIGKYADGLGYNVVLKLEKK